ncbi:MAG: hypothetical protein ACOYL1_04265 [Chlamydiia bacterium]
MSRYIYCLLISLRLFSGDLKEVVNPFEIDFPIKKELTFEDYQLVQEKLRKIDLFSLLDERYPEHWKKKNPFVKRVIYDDFAARLYRGLVQTMIDPERGLYPEKKLIKINEGGADCIVIFSSFDRIYPQYVLSLIKALEEVGYDGWIYYRLGGYPNPTGEEIRYSGVPYAFKLFMLEEARDLGFRYLLWLDTSLLPLKSPKPLFEALHTKGVLYKETAPLLKYMLPATLEEIYQFTGRDITTSKHLRMPVFGVDTHLEWFDDFLLEHKKLVRLGTPFFSCLPEEFVLTALKDRFFPNSLTPTEMLVGFDYTPSVKNGYYFYLRHH